MLRTSLVKIGGISALLTVAFCLPWSVFPIIAPALGIQFPQSLDMGEWARLKTNHHVAFLTLDWFVIFCLVFEVAAVLGFFWVLQEAGPVTWLGLAAWLMGLLLVMVEHIFVLEIDSALYPKYIAASEAMKPALEVAVSTLNGTRFLAALVGNMLALGVGVPIFALASLRARRVPRWIAWLGLGIALMKWLSVTAYFPAAPRLIAEINRLAVWGFMLWLVAMGVAWLRLREPVH